MIAEIRGALGTQVISYAALRDVTAIYLNVGKPTDPDDYGSIDYLSDIIENCPPVMKVDGKRKVPIDLWDAALIGAPRLRIKGGIPKRGDTLLHVRHGTRQSTSDDVYKRLSKEMQTIGNGPFAWGSAVDDWRAVLGAAVVYTSITTFTISAAMVNPAMQLRIFEPDADGVPPPAALAALRRLTGMMPNVEWIKP